MFYFNPIPPPYLDDDTDNDYLNAVDNYIDEEWLQEKFSEALEKEKENDEENEKLYCQSGTDSGAVWNLYYQWNQH